MQAVQYCTVCASHGKPPLHLHNHLPTPQAPKCVAASLCLAGLATLLFDLPSEEEAQQRHNMFDIICCLM
jgi:hypothetical protein